MPVLHEGYRRFFESHSDARIMILGRDITQNFRPLVKDLRALDPQLVRQAIQSWGIGESVTVAASADLKQLASTEATTNIVMPDEDINHALAEQYFSEREIYFDPIFLRWDRRRSEAKTVPEPSRTISRGQLNQELMLQAHDASPRSSDIWRQVGALIAKNGKVLLAAHNQSLPTANTAWTDGDPRINSNQGIAIETSTFIHAEAALIAEAAKRGLPLEGTHVYVTTFPCPVCAKLIAASGIKTVYYAEGYAMLDGQQVLDATSIELIQVDVALPPATDSISVPYPKK